MNPLRKILIAGGLTAATLAGGALGASLVGTAGAQGTTSTTATTTASTTASSGTGTQQAPPAGAPGARPDGKQGPHEVNGITETVLTGTTKTKAEAAAKAAVSGGTVERSETDAEGAKYEVHMTKADGSDVTVKLDASFKVTSIEKGHA